MALNTIYNAIDSKVFEQIKDLDRACEVWKRLEETYEGAPVVKSAKLYIIKDKLTSFKIKDDESIPKIFHRLKGGVNKDEKKEDEDKKKKSVAFKTNSSSKNKSKSKKQSSDDEDASDIDDEAMALLVRKIGKFMKKKGYGARKRRDDNKEYVRRCYKCKSLGHIVADCPYNSDNNEDEKKKPKKEMKEKKEKKEKKKTFTKKKKGSGYVVT
ncbi:uncharacterized protein [Miscanthus floridulus]|uniref:uncharacterized protein n=1 Tax=Miscanthus floridulus TaxID=154761 RepID=UPI00345B46F3